MIFQSLQPISVLPVCEGIQAEQVITPAAKAFLLALHQNFEDKRQALLELRLHRQKEISEGKLPDFLEETADIRQDQWRVYSVPPDLERRTVEITGPTDRKMIINALNSGAEVFMADFEDATSPTWENILTGQCNLFHAVRRKIDFTSEEGKSYALKEKVAVLMVRPRGWHLTEDHFMVDGVPISASLFDFGLYFFHNAEELIRQGSGPYFYLPKLESHLEARLWNEVFEFAQDYLWIPEGTIKATVLIETLPAAFEMEEIIYELRKHLAGLNAGRWDYIFSTIKKLRDQPGVLTPDRTQITMRAPFMQAYTQLLIKTCHKRGAHAIGGMAAFIPNRRDEQVNARAMEQVKLDKDFEASNGFDGTWVAHPDLVPVAKEAFLNVLGDAPHQKNVLRSDVQVSAADLLNINVEGGKITLAGLKLNLNVAIEYIANWLNGLGAVAINNLMEDAATAEISRAQVWQWIKHQVKLDTGEQVDVPLVEGLINEELTLLMQRSAAGLPSGSLYEKAAHQIRHLVTNPEFEDFLTPGTYQLIK